MCIHLFLTKAHRFALLMICICCVRARASKSTSSENVVQTTQLAVMSSHYNIDPTSQITTDGMMSEMRSEMQSEQISLDTHVLPGIHRNNPFGKFSDIENRSV